MGKRLRTYGAIFREPEQAETAAVDLVKAGVGFTHEAPGRFLFKTDDEDRAIDVFASGKPDALDKESRDGGPWHSISLDGRGVEREEKKMEQTHYTDTSCLTCLFTQMNQVSIADGKLKVLGDLGYWPAVEGSVEADFEIEVDYETGTFRAHVDGPLKKDSHPIKYHAKVGDLEDEDDDEDGE